MPLAAEPGAAGLTELWKDDTGRPLYRRPSPRAERPAYPLEQRRMTVQTIQLQGLIPFTRASPAGCG